MRLWQRSIQWQLILSMGAALLASILIVVGIYSAVVDRLTERYLIEEALPARALAIRNDLERVLTAPITANASIAENSLVQDWLAAGEDAARRDEFARYLEGVRAQQNAMTTSIVALASGNYTTGEGLMRTLDRSTSTRPRACRRCSSTSASSAAVRPSASLAWGTTSRTCRR